MNAFKNVAYGFLLISSLTLHGHSHLLEYMGQNVVTFAFYSLLNFIKNPKDYNMDTLGRTLARTAVTTVSTFCAVRGIFIAATSLDNTREPMKQLLTGAGCALVGGACIKGYNSISTDKITFPQVLVGLGLNGVTGLTRQEQSSGIYHRS